MLYDAGGKPVRKGGDLDFDSFFNSTMKAYETALQDDILKPKWPSVRDVFGVNIYGPRGEVVANTGAKMVSGGRIRCPVNR